MTAVENLTMQLPNDQQAEQAVLGAIIENNHIFADILTLLTPSCFYQRCHQHIYEAMIELAENNLPIDEVIIGDRLKLLGKLEETGGYAFLAEVAESAPSFGNIIFYAKIIKEHAVIRDLIKFGNELSNKSQNPKYKISELLNEAEKKIVDLSQFGVQDELLPLKDALTHGFKRLEEMADRPDDVNGVPTGYRHLDQLTSGLQPSDLIIVAARPSMGKTALALNIATYASLCREVKGAILIFSLEMPAEQLALRVLSSEARVDSNKLRTGNLSQKDFDDLALAINRLSTSNIVINRPKRLTPYDLVSTCRKTDRQSDHGLSLVIIDYLQLMRGRNINAYGSREQEVADISRNLKEMALELNVPVMALSQLNREPEKRQDKRPQLSDLRESGSLEQDADIIIFIHREERYNRETDNKGIAEIIVAKHRNGPIGEFNLAFVKQFSKFANLHV
jgi:replicative DNA helicase